MGSPEAAGGDHTGGGSGEVMSKKQDRKKARKQPGAAAFAHYLRVEAVNLGSFVYNTADLSTIRGGLLVLRAKDVAERYLRDLPGAM